MLKQYNLFLESFQFACKNYKGNTNEADIAKVMRFNKDSLLSFVQSAETIAVKLIGDVERLVGNDK